MKRNWNLQRLLVMMVGASVLVGCSQNPTGPTPKNQNNQIVHNAAATGIEVFRSVHALQQIDQALGGSERLLNINLPAIGRLEHIGVRLSQALAPFHQQTQLLAVKASRLREVAGDSLLWEARWVDSVTGINYHGWIIYNTDHGIVIVNIAATAYPSSSPLDRDSTRVVVNVNFTLADTTDDVVVLFENAKNYRAGHRLQYEEGRFLPDSYLPGSQPTGGAFEGLSVYAPGQDTTDVKFHLEHHGTDSRGIGNFAKIVNFRDGTHHSENIMFTSTNVIFEINNRDGTHEQGRYTKIDENHLSFARVVTYPDGSDPHAITESGNFSHNPADSSGSANIRRQVIHADGASDWDSISVKETRQNGFRHVEVTETRGDSTGGSWTLQEGANSNTVSGSWVDKEKHYALFNGTFHQDGSGDLHIAVYASKAAYNNSELPIFTADLHFSPGGSGNGMVTGKEGTVRADSL